MIHGAPGMRMLSLVSRVVSIAVFASVAPDLLRRPLRRRPLRYPGTSPPAFWELACSSGERERRGWLLFYNDQRQRLREWVAAKALAKLGASGAVRDGDLDPPVLGAPGTGGV
jgi:hypothetical protein